MIDLNYRGSYNLISDGCHEKKHIRNNNNKRKEINASIKQEFEYYKLNNHCEKDKKEDNVIEQIKVLAENVDEIFFDIKTDPKALQNDAFHLKDSRNESIDPLNEEDIMNSININNNGKKRKYSLIDYKVLCRKNKMSVIDIVENPSIEKELIDVVKKANLKVHWGIEHVEFIERNSDNNNENNIEKIKACNNKNKNNRSIINNPERENELDAAIDLLKSYYQLKETFIYYISQSGELLPANMSVFQKVINIKLSNDKAIKINIESIKKIEDKLINSRYIKIHNLQNINLIVIKYEKLSKLYYFPIIFKDKLKLCLFLSLLKSYHRINFKEFSEDAIELVSRYSLGVNVKKVSKNGKISDCKILISDNIIRFFSINKMKGKVFDILEDFISYETCIDVSYFNLLGETQKKYINQEECVVLHFINTSIPLIFPSLTERDNFIMLFLFLRN